MAERMIPLLPCASLSATLEFYGVLGFDCTHQQTTPNVYAALQRGGIHLHFFGLKQLKPENSYSTCLVILDDLEGLHAAYSAALRQALGRLPLAPGAGAADRSCEGPRRAHRAGHRLRRSAEDRRAPQRARGPAAVRGRTTARTRRAARRVSAVTMMTTKPGAHDRIGFVRGANAGRRRSVQLRKGELV